MTIAANEDKITYNSSLSQHESDPALWTRTLRGMGAKYMERRGIRMRQTVNQLLDGLDSLSHPRTFDGYMAYWQDLEREVDARKEEATAYQQNKPKRMTDAPRLKDEIKRIRLIETTPGLQEMEVFSDLSDHSMPRRKFPCWHPALVDLIPPDAELNRFYLVDWTVEWEAQGGKPELIAVTGDPLTIKPIPFTEAMRRHWEATLNRIPTQFRCDPALVDRFYGQALGELTIDQWLESGREIKYALNGVLAEAQRWRDAQDEQDRAERQQQKAASELAQWFPRCPKCNSADITGLDAKWHCDDCQHAWPQNTAHADETVQALAQAGQAMQETIQEEAASAAQSKHLQRTIIWFNSECGRHKVKVIDPDLDVNDLRHRIAGVPTMKGFSESQCAIFEKLATAYLDEHYPLETKAMTAAISQEQWAEWYAPYKAAGWTIEDITTALNRIQPQVKEKWSRWTGTLEQASQAIDAMSAPFGDPEPEAPPEVNDDQPSKWLDPMQKTSTVQTASNEAAFVVCFDMFNASETLEKFTLRANDEYEGFQRMLKFKAMLRSQGYLDRIQLNQQPRPPAPSPAQSTALAQGAAQTAVVGLTETIVRVTRGFDDKGRYHYTGLWTLYNGQLPQFAEYKLTDTNVGFLDQLAALTGVDWSSKNTPVGYEMNTKITAHYELGKVKPKSTSGAQYHNLMGLSA